MNKQLRNLEDKLIACITNEVPEEPGAVTLVSITLSAMLVKLSKANGMTKEDFIGLMNEAWDGITQETH